MLRNADSLTEKFNSVETWVAAAAGLVAGGKMNGCTCQLQREVTFLWDPVTADAVPKEVTQC